MDVAEVHGRRVAEARRGDAATRNRRDDVGNGVDAAHGVGADFDQEQVAGSIRGQAAGQVELSGQRIAAIPLRSAVSGRAGAGHTGDDLGGDIHLAHGAVKGIFAEIHVAGRVDRYSCGYRDRGAGRRAAIAGVAEVIQATAREGGDHAAREIHPAHAVRAAIRDVEDIVRRAKCDGLDGPEFGGGRLAPVTGVAVVAVASDGADDATRADATDAEIESVRDVHRAVGRDGHVVGTVERRRGGGAAIARNAGEAVAGDGRDIRCERGGGNKKGEAGGCDKASQACGAKEPFHYFFPVCKSAIRGFPGGGRKWYLR